MKYFYTLVLCASMFSGIAQPTFHGVRNIWNGEFVSYNNANNETKLLYAIDNDGYGAGFAQLLHASDSKLYGTAASGGSFNGGVLFSVDPSSGQFTRLANFTRPNLFNPSSSLVEVADGRLFGTAYFNDSTDVNGGGGVIYSYNRQTKELTIEARVSDENGGYIQQGLAYDKENTLYGATFGPGSDQPGVLFSFDIKQKSLTIIHRFSIENHTATSSGLVFGPDGKLYGVNAEGGMNHAGELYAFNPILSTLEVVHTFGDPYETGGYETSPNGTPTLATDGKLYGILKTYADGEGFIYSYEPSTHTYDIAFHFDPDFIPQYAIIFGGSAAVGLVSDAGNQLFGYSLNNGLYAFNIETKQVTTWNKNQAIFTTDESSTLAFTGPDGVIKINTTTEEWAVRKRLFAETGSYLTKNLLFDQNGVLYGRTQYGGNGNKGVLFAFDPKNGSYNVLMDSTLGQRGNMIMGFDQNIYLSTRTFGPTPFTTIDRISLQDRTQSTIHYFGVYPGALPGPSEYIMQASDSLIYWLKPFGGASSPAGIYSYSIPTDRIGKLATIPQGYSFIPWLTEGIDKTLYGFGSSLADVSKRLIFSFNIGANSVTTFPYSYSLFGDGIDQPPVADRAGNIYAATFQSGLYDMGTIFRFIPATGQFEKIVDLNEQTGIRVSNLLLASDSLIYGLSFSTSRYSDGNLFSIDPDTKQFQIVRKITAEDPLFTTFVELPVSGHQGIEIKDATVSESDGKAEVLLSIDPPTDIPLKFRFRTVEGTATPHVDYTAKSGNVHIRPGMTTGKIVIPIRQDKITEGDETFYVVIENSKKNLSVIDKDTALVTIHDSKRKPGNSEVILNSKPKNSTINSTNFSVVVGPNPSSGSFRIQLNGNTKQLIDLRITNAVGIEIGRKRGLRTGQTIVLGERYRQGIYFLTVQSGRISNTMVLIKE